MMFNKRILATTIIFSAMLMTACSEGEEVQEPAEVEIAEEIPGAEEELLPYVTPFTGERVAEEVTMRPTLATINNHPLARPQSGLAQADVVYEMLAEGEVTRLLALYQSEMPESVGPIRSARIVFY